MTMMSSSDVKRLPLHEIHAQNSAKFGHFGDWEVPLYYTTILEEHDAVRNRAGLFDISHMGKFYAEGPAVVSFLDAILPRSIAAMRHGQALYMPLLNEKGGFVDDIIVYRISDTRFFIIVNAANIAKDFEWMAARKPKDVVFDDLSPKTGLIALQGPAAPDILDKAFPGNGFKDLKYYGFKEWQGGMIARTGYTGEDGYEIMADLKNLPEIWNKLMQAGKDQGLVPVGFGARDTLRLEAGMLLYGHDMNDDTTPLEANVPWALDLNKTQFVGKEPLVLQKQKGIARRVVGFEMVDRGIPRQDYEILKNGKPAGKVTSGSFSPTLKKNIGMGYVPVELAVPGTEIEIQVRDKALKAQVVKLPFYKRKGK
jgi:aminomethyltransferase